MKKVLSLFLALMLVLSTACAFAEAMDLSFLDEMSDRDLEDLRSQIDSMLVERKKEALQSGDEDAVEATRTNPAPLGVAVMYEENEYTGNEYTISIVSANKGKGAAAVLKSFNRYNTRKLKKGEQWVLLQLHIEAIAADGEKVDLSEYNFRFVSKDGVEYENAYISDNPSPVTALYVGSQQYAWVATVVKDTDSPLLTYKSYSGDTTAWFSLSDRMFKGDEITAETLQKGDDNEDVTVLQRLLLELDYFQFAPTGDYEKNTIAAVKSFQKANGLKSTGIADEETIKLLISGEAK